MPKTKRSTLSGDLSTIDTRMKIENPVQRREWDRGRVVLRKSKQYGVKTVSVWRRSARTTQRKPRKAEILR
jgi:hypothetical protein